MTPHEYFELANRTSRDLGTKKNIVHASLGIISEIGELADMLKRNLAYGKPFDKINLVEECGDVMWYIPLMCRQFSIDFASLFPTREYALDPVDVLVEDLVNWAGPLVASARTCHEHSLTPTFVPHLSAVVRTLDKICRAAGYTLEEAMLRNIMKLNERFPDGFTEWAALNRDLIAERRVLEGDQARV